MKRLFFIGIILFAACNTSITKYKNPDTLTKQQIIEYLKSGDFKKVLKARTQLGRLEPKERLNVLKELLQEKKPELRLTAVTELEKLKPLSCPVLEEVAKKDQDPDVKDQATQAAKGCVKSEDHNQ